MARAVEEEAEVVAGSWEVDEVADTRGEMMVAAVKVEVGGAREAGAWAVEMVAEGAGEAGEEGVEGVEVATEPGDSGEVVLEGEVQAEAVQEEVEIVEEAVAAVGKRAASMGEEAREVMAMGAAMAGAARTGKAEAEVRAVPQVVRAATGACRVVAVGVGSVEVNGGWGTVASGMVAVRAVGTAATVAEEVAARTHRLALAAMAEAAHSEVAATVARRRHLQQQVHLQTRRALDPGNYHQVP